jgi:hypothetical protein
VRRGWWRCRKSLNREDAKNAKKEKERKKEIEREVVLKIPFETFALFAVIAFSQQPNVIQF